MHHLLIGILLMLIGGTGLVTVCKWYTDKETLHRTDRRILLGSTIFLITMGLTLAALTLQNG